jgi:hypothetical protein
MIDVATEHLLTLSEAAKLLPGKVSVTTLWRWRLHGIRGRKLESVMLGGKVYTSREAIQRFARQLGGTDAAAIRSPRQREKAIRKAEAELAKAGI